MHIWAKLKRVISRIANSLMKTSKNNNVGGGKCCAESAQEGTLQYKVTWIIRLFKLCLINKQKQQYFFSKCDLQKPQGGCIIMYRGAHFYLSVLRRGQLPVGVWVVSLCWSFSLKSLLNKQLNSFFLRNNIQIIPTKCHIVSMQENKQSTQAYI